VSECILCLGQGTMLKRRSYHGDPGDTIEVECDRCKGTGKEPEMDSAFRNQEKVNDSTAMVAALRATAEPIAWEGALRLMEALDRARMAEAKVTTLVSILGRLATTASSPCEGDFKCDKCAVVMKPEHFAALMEANVFLAANGWFGTQDQRDSDETTPVSGSELEAAIDPFDVEPSDSEPDFDVVTDRELQERIPPR